MNPKFYLLLPKDEKNGGLVEAPEDWSYPIDMDGKEVTDWQSLVLELKYGKYAHFNMCTGGANIISEELKKLFESFVDDPTLIEYLPVKVFSKEYGDKWMYIMHFKKIFDVVDKKNSIYVPGTDILIKERLIYDKVKDLKIFNIKKNLNDVVVSEEVYQAIKKQKLNFCIEFVPIYCSASTTT